MLILSVVVDTLKGKKEKRWWWRQWCEKEGKEVWWEKIVVVSRKRSRKDWGRNNETLEGSTTLLWRDLFVYIPVELPVRFFTLNLMQSLHNVQWATAAAAGQRGKWQKTKEKKWKWKMFKRGRDCEVVAALSGKDVLRCKCALCVCRTEKKDIFLCLSLGSTVHCPPCRPYFIGTADAASAAAAVFTFLLALTVFLN